MGLFNEYEFHESDRYAVEIRGIQDPSIPTGPENLLFQAIRSLIGRYEIGREVPLKVVNTVDVPVGKGLGSSATAVAAGLLAANHIYGLGLDTQQLICAGLDIEPHPDNIAPCLAGGLVICYENGCCSYEKIPLSKDALVMLLVPDFPLSTNDARKLIPEKVPLQDAIFNLSHFALLVKSLQENDLDRASVFIRDRLHQPYRRKVYERSMEIVDMLNEQYQIPSAISGSGPAVFAILDKKRRSQHLEEIKDRLQKDYKDFKMIMTAINNQGSRVG